MDISLIKDFSFQFPPPESAQDDGLLCVGGDLTPERLLAAYGLGIFPWYSDGEPILWWAPSPRCVLPLDTFHLSRRTLRYLRKQQFSLTCNQAFALVIRDCARLRSEGTWITNEMIYAYEELHRLGYATSIEVWQGRCLVGGLYGVHIGRAFFGESMFHTCSEASRQALLGLVTLLKQRGTVLLDCQQETEHMARMGAIMISRSEFTELLRVATLPEEGDSICRPWDKHPQWDALQLQWSGV